MTKEERAGQGKVSQVPTSPSPTQDPLTRLWKGADSSHGHHLEAVSELRERKRREQESSRRLRRRHRKRGSGVSEPAERVECARCRQTVERTGSERVAIPSPVGEAVQHLLCSRCADEVHRGLLRLLAGQEPLPAFYPEEQEVPVSIPARAGWLAFRMAAYGLIGLATFTLVTWLVLR